MRRRTDGKNRLLADLDAELELQVAENLLDEAVNLVGGQRLVSGLEGQAERHALLVRAELFAACGFNVTQRRAYDAARREYYRQQKNAENY